MLHSTLAVLLLLGNLVAAVPPAPGRQGQNPAAASQRQMPPGEADRVRCRNQIDGIFDFSKRFAAKEREAVRQLANDLLAEAQKGQDNTPGTVFLLLTMAIEAAEKIGDATIIEGAFTTMGQQFFVDAPVLAYDSAARMARNSQSGCKALDLVRLFVHAGIGSLPISQNTVKRALTEAEAQAKRCAGSKDDHAAALALVATLKAAIANAKVSAERVGAGETLPRAEVPPATDAVRAATRTTIKASLGDLDQKSKREVELLRATHLAEGLATKKNAPGVRYEYLLSAKDLAVRVGDATAVVQTIDELGVQFAVNGPELLVAAARDSVKRAVAPAQDLTRLLLMAAKAQVPIDAVLARQLLKEAEGQRERHRANTQLYKELGLECSQALAELDDAETYAGLQKAVTEQPNDAKASERLGWFLCVRRETWAEGLLFLAKGEALVLVPGTLASDVAKKELASPVTDDMAWEIAEAWWAFAEAKESQAVERPALRRHARSWYKKIEHLKDVRRRKIEACLREDAPVVPAASVPAVGASPAAAAGNASEPLKPRQPTAKDAPVAEAIDLALSWLSMHQDADGRWDCSTFMRLDPANGRCDGGGNAAHDVGVTALAVMAFLASGHTDTTGSYSETVRSGLTWLGQQQDSSGRFSWQAGDFIYDHSMATLAMARAAKATGNQTWTGHAKSGVGYLLLHKNPEAAWRYQPQDHDNDLSVTTWCLAAVRASKDVGYVVDDLVWTTAGAYVQGLASADGRFGYTRPGEGSSRKVGDHRARFPSEKGEAMTAAGLYCLHLLGQAASRGSIAPASAAQLADKPPSLDPGCADSYYWYHGTVALRLQGGPTWTKWWKALRTVALPSQRRDNNFTGSWDPTDAWGEDGGRIATTAFLCLALQVGAFE